MRVYVGHRDRQGRVAYAPLTTQTLRFGRVRATLDDPESSAFMVSTPSEDGVLRPDTLLVLPAEEVDLD